MTIAEHAPEVGFSVVRLVVDLLIANGDLASAASLLQEFVKRAIAPYKYPRAIEFTASLPRTETGKLQRFRLRQQERAKAASRS